MSMFINYKWGLQWVKHRTTVYICKYCRGGAINFWLGGYGDSEIAQNEIVSAMVFTYPYSDNVVGVNTPLPSGFLRMSPEFKSKFRYNTPISLVGETKP